MKPNKQIIEKFRRIYFEEFGEKISTREAYDRFLRLVTLLEVILRDKSKKEERMANLHSGESN